MAKKDDRDPFKTPSRSWFIVFNNPENHGYSGEPEEILNQLRDEWIGDSTTRTGMWAYAGLYPGHEGRGGLPPELEGNPVQL